MWRDGLVALVILAGGAAAALAANALREKPLPLIRRDLQSLKVSPKTNAADQGAKDAAAAENDGQRDIANAADAMPSSPADAPVAREGPVKIITADAVIEHLTNGTAFFIDAREHHEYEEGHLQGAINLPSSAIYQQIDNVLSVVPADQAVVVYCGGGQCEASHNVADALVRDFGFINVSIYEKGWEEVTASGRFADRIHRGDQP